MTKTQSRRNLTRRDFTRALAAGACAALAGPGALAGEKTSSRSAPIGPFLDDHVHVGLTVPGTERIPLTAKMLLEWMDRHAIEQAAVLPVAANKTHTGVDSEAALEIARPHRDRLTPFCVVDPRAPLAAKPRELRDTLRRWVEAGARGFGEHKIAGLAIDAPQNMRLYEASAELRLPVLIHTDNVYNTDEVGLPRLRRVLAAFPECLFIMHAPGWWASISGDLKQFGGYPKGKVAPGGAVDELLAKHKNLYGDLSAGSGANAISRDPEFGRAFLIRHADRLLFGTDKLSAEQKVPQFDLMERMQLPQEIQEKIFRENTRKIWRRAIA